jgi:hypothetical protein
MEGRSMTKCWRCGGGKTITMTTTGTHVLPCPTCGGSGEFPFAPEEERKKVAVWQHPEVEKINQPFLGNLKGHGTS